MTTRRTVLKVEELGARVLPSSTAVIPTAATAAIVQTTTTTSTWAGQGRFAISTTSSTGAKIYQIQGSTQLKGSTNYSITGSVQSVGNKAGQATGRITISDPHGTLTLALTGATQSAHAALPTKFNYTVVSGTGTFAHSTGPGTMTLSLTLFPGLTDKGSFTVSGTMPKTSTPVPTPKPPAPKPPAPSPTTTGPSWMGHGRFTLTKNSATKSTSYQLQGSADFGSSGFLVIGGTIQTVGNKAGHATGRITISDKRGTLTLAVTGPTQSANSGLPAKFTYKVLSGTGFFAHYAGTGTIQLSVPLFPGYTNKGHFDVAVKPTGK